MTTIKSFRPNVRQFVAALAMVGALMAIVGSFGVWYTGSATEDGYGLVVHTSLTVTGTGSGEFSQTIDHAPDYVREAMDADVALKNGEFSRKRTNSPGDWTLYAGVLVAAGAIVVLLGRYARIGAIAALIGALALTAIAVVCVFDPASAVLKDTVSAMPPGWESGVGWGLWLALAGAVVAVVSTGIAVIWTCFGSWGRKLG